jgi:ribosome-associated translation inhibitor RaiA
MAVPVDAMTYPLEIVLRDMPGSDALRQLIGEHAHRLERMCDRIRSCRVLVEVLHREKQPQAKFAVRLIVTLPGTEVVFNREHAADVRVAVREAFAAAGLQLEEHMRRRGTHVGRTESDARNARI